MANKQVLSVVAASILAASMAFTGCGSSSSSSKPVVSSSSSVGTSSSTGTTSSAGSSSSENNSSAGTSSSVATMTSVVVSDAYIINATVKVGGTALIAAAAGTYESAEVLTGAITVADGVNDLNGNGIVDSSDGNNSDYDVVAVKMQAASGSENVNPFTTLSVMGMKNMATTFPTAAAIDAGYDFDVVANTTLDLAKEVLIAALTVQANTPTNAAATRDFLPEPGDVTATSSSTAATSSVSSEADTGFLPEPGDSFKYVSQTTIDAINAMTSMDEINAAFRAHFAAASTTASTSSDGGFLPGPGTPGSSSAAAVSSTAATSSTGGGFLPEVN